MKNKTSIDFSEVANLIRKDTYTDVSTMDFIIQFMDLGQPLVASAVAKHIRDILGEIEHDIDYTEVIVETYRRTFFDATAAAKYGTESIASSPEYRHQLAEYLLIRNDLDERGTHSIFPIARQVQ